MPLSKPTLKQIEEWYLKYKSKIPDTDKVKISPVETVADPKTFIEANIATLKKYPGNKRMLPYYTRLTQIYYHYVRTIN